MQGEVFVCRRCNGLFDGDPDEASDSSDPCFIRVQSVAKSLMSSKPIPLKAPFPYFGGKSKVADLVWSRLGDVRNYLEPFCGSAALLLLRPHEPQVETVNDKDCFIANFWRATKADPEAVVKYCNHPVNEADLHARHRWLVLSDDAIAFRERMRRDPDYYDAKIAGWWVWGQCCWIGGGWCNTKWQNAGFVEGRTADGDVEERRPSTNKIGNGIHAKGGKVPNLTSHDGNGTGVHVKRPKLTGNGVGTGVHSGSLSQQLPDISGDGATGRGIHASAGPSSWNQRPVIEQQCGVLASGRPQLADQFSRGRGVHGHDVALTCEMRRLWLLDWFCRLHDRLRTVRVCCGDWNRVCGSRSTTTRIGQTGILLEPPSPPPITGIAFDPPYLGDVDGKTSRDGSLYAEEDLTVAHAVRAFCIEHGSDPEFRIALCGLDGEHNELEKLGWEVVAWKAAGGYGNRNAENTNRDRERIWFSPHCLKPTRDRGLFD